MKLKTKNARLVTLKLVITFSIMASSGRAQNNISLVRYNDNFSEFKNDSLKKSFGRLKYISLGHKNYISFGGELREQFQLFKNINFGDVPPVYPAINPKQLNHRLMVHANIELGTHFRFFIQLNNTVRFFNPNPAVPEIDENQLSVHQAFAELKLKHWNFRAGRQELFYGNHRLITVREGPNTRQTFDGLLVKKTNKNGAIDFFALTKVISKSSVFDDQSFGEGLIGIYGTQYFYNRTLGLDYYVVNFQSRLRKYNHMPGFENRKTCGLRIFSNFRELNFEVEGAYQSGKFGNLKISAFNLVADVNLMAFPSKKTIIGLAANVASGDKSNDDHKLNTYNLLFAKPAYGLAIPVGSTNILSLYPYIKINPLQKLNVLAQVFFLARYSDQDGTYSPGMIQNRPRPELSFNTAERKLGIFYILETNFQESKNLSFAFDASYFRAGSYPKKTGKGNDITYLSFKSTFRL